MRRAVASRSAGSTLPASPLEQLLLKAEEVDLEFIIGILKSSLGFSADRVMQDALALHHRERSIESKRALARLLDHEIRYAGSSDLAYLLRWLWRDDAGVPPDKLLTDVAKRLNVKLRMIGSFEAKLQRLVRSVVERELLEMSAEQQQELITSQGMGPSKMRDLLTHLKQTGRILGLSLLMTMAGREAGERIATTIVVRVITAAVGRHAAAHLFKSLATRFPWWAEWIGPAAWAMTGAWMAHDLQGPAFRKTIPVTLYLGLVLLRDHPESALFD